MELLTIAETAKLLKLNPMTVRRYIAAGTLPAVRIGRGIRIRRETLEALAAPSAREQPSRGPEEYRFHRPSPREIARRQALHQSILAKRAERDIGPLTSVDLVRAAREQDERLPHGGG